MEVIESVQHATTLAKSLYLFLSTLTGQLQGEQAQFKLNTQKLFILGQDESTPTLPMQIDNQIKTTTVSTKKENTVFMQRIKKTQNVYKRADGRYEWRKMINGFKHYIIDNNFETLCKKVSEYKNKLKERIGKQVSKQSLFEITKSYYERVILGKVKTKLLKPVSAAQYKQSLNYIKVLNKPIEFYTKDDIIDFFNSIKAHRTGSYCFYIIKHVFADEFEKGNIQRNPIATLKTPFSQKRWGQKRTWLNLEEQRILKANLDNSILCKEILFYLLTGCRLEEAYNAKINFEKQFVEITRKKTEFSGVKTTYIPLSKKYLDMIKDDWDKMFKIHSDNMTKNIKSYLEKLGIKNKTTHNLRHTFSTNTYYLGVDPKKQQYLMGHASITQTYDTYTSFDITITKQDIIDIWGEDLYPEF